MKRRLLLTSLVAVIAACPAEKPLPTPQPRPINDTPGYQQPRPVGPAQLETLAEHQAVHGFTTEAIYLDDADKPMGARFHHEATGFTLDYLRIQSAPQGALYVHSFPTSDKGEPHTQEHLLLGKGNRGRRLGSEEVMELAESTAFTEQWRTCYLFNTVAGHDVFWPVFEGQLDALLHPDYTDEEIRREVRNFGVDKAADGKLSLEEKGTVYNEMVRTYEEPEAPLYRTAGQLVYGAQHPLALESGGYPAAIRGMTPEDIRTFHADHYFLANMGMVAAFPSSMALDDVLAHTDQILTSKADGKTHPMPMTEATLPPPSPAPTGKIEIAEYPSGTTSSPGPILYAWPANRTLDDSERLLLELFMDAFAGDSSTTLYKKLIDTKSRVMDLGASSVGGSVSSDVGHAVYIGFDGVPSAKLDDKTIQAVRDLIGKELARIAALPDNDPELVAFDQRVQSRLVERRRQRTKFLDTPPSFGHRGVGGGWIALIHDVAQTGTFRRSLTQRTALAKVGSILATGGNPWKDRLKTWGLLDVPYGVAATPSPALRTHLDEERDGRIARETEALAKKYGAKDTLAEYAKAYDAESAKIEAAAKATPMPPLVTSLPQTFDDELQYVKMDSLKGIVAKFDTMASTRVDVALSLDGVPNDDLFYLALFPALLTDVGVMGDKAPIAAEEVRERLRKEILSLHASFIEDGAGKRHELLVSGSGNDVKETRAALQWMAQVMLKPYWAPANLPRLRDVIQQRMTALHQVMQGAEEDWVDGTRDAWWRQNDAVHLHTDSFLTQENDLLRLKWMLADPGDATAQEAAAKWLDALAGAKGTRAQLLAAAGKKLPAGKAEALAKDAAKDLAVLVAELPDGSLAKDWSYLCRQMAHDLRLGAPPALAGLERVRQAIVSGGNARYVVTGSSANAAAIDGELHALAVRLSDHRADEPKREAVKQIEERVKARDASVKQLAYVGLLDPATSSGVFLNTAPAPGYTATSDADVADYLTSNLYTGHGAHSMFMKTWAAGLAYSNGLHPQPAHGRLEYYAERCPLLPQTLKFVIAQLQGEKPDPAIARYAVAKAFDSRAVDRYEVRAAAMAADLADGLTPDVIKAFRKKVLELANKPDLADTLFARLPAVYGRVLPGFSKATDASPGAISFVIGPDKQLAAYDKYLKVAVGKDAQLVRLYPRDFWFVEKLP